MKLHLEIQIKVHCPIVQNHFQPVSALCFGWCNYCVLMRVIIDCWSQQMKINSLCIMTFPIRLTHLCFRAHCSPFCTQTPPTPPLLELLYIVHLPVFVRHPHTPDVFSLLRAYTTSEISFKCAHFHFGPEG